MKNIQYREQLDFQPQIHKNANGKNDTSKFSEHASSSFPLAYALLLNFNRIKPRKATGFNYRNKETTADMCPILGREYEIIYRIGPKKGPTIRTKNVNKK